MPFPENQLEKRLPAADGFAVLGVAHSHINDPLDSVIEDNKVKEPQANPGEISGIAPQERSCRVGRHSVCL